jgi:hypothetical protein
LKTGRKMDLEKKPKKTLKILVVDNEPSILVSQSRLIDANHKVRC